jgi:hypothetical protein
VKVLMVRVKRKRRVGRPRGRSTSLHKLPSVQASVKAVIEEVVTEKKLSIKHAIIDGIESGPRNAHNYIRMCAEYLDGKPATELNVRTNFKEDEVADAQRSLSRKMNRLFERIMVTHAEEIDVTPVADTALAARAK